MPMKTSVWVWLLMLTSATSLVITALSYCDWVPKLSNRRWHSVAVTRLRISSSGSVETARLDGELVYFVAIVGRDIDIGQEARKRDGFAFSAASA